MVDGPQTGGQPGDGEPERGDPTPLLAGLEALGLDLAQLMHVLQAPGPLNWIVAERVASSVATSGETEPEIDPGAEAELQELVRAAQTQVVAETGLTATFAAPVRTVGRGDWADLQLQALRPVLDAYATALAGAMGAPGAQPELPPEMAAMGMEAFAAVLPKVVALFLGFQAGSMAGYLAQHALGRYDLPLPTADEPSLLFVVSNIDAFEAAWSLERTDLRFYVALHEVVHAAQRSVPWVRERLVGLATEYVSSYEIDPEEIESRVGPIDPSDPMSFQRLAEHPEDLLGAMQSDRQREVLARARVFHAVLEGYADDVLARIGARLLPSFARIHEAMQRHRIERGDAARFIESLLGLTLERDDYERGAAFCAGVVERAGTDGLNRLWERAEMAPTRNELEAPGLWLARIELPDSADGGDAT